MGGCFFLQRLQTISKGNVQFYLFTFVNVEIVTNFEVRITHG